MDAPRGDDSAAAICYLRTLSHFFRKPALRAGALRARLRLGHEIESLNDEVTEISGLLVVSARGKTQGIIRSAETLLDLRELAHDAEGLLDDMDSHRLDEAAQQIQGSGFAGSSSSQAAYRSAKSMPDDLYPRIDAVIGRSLKIVGDLSQGLDLGQLDPSAYISGELELAPPWIYRPPANTTSSTTTMDNLIGRDVETRQILELLTEGFSSRDLSVLPLVGPAGIGKTALARHIYEHERVAEHFNSRRWISLPFPFDPVYFARDMLDFVANNRYDRIEDLARLLQILGNHLKRRNLKRRFLLVLDVIRDWELGSQYTWDSLLAPWKDNMEIKGNVILATTRSAAVARAICTEPPIFLPRLEQELFCDFFKCCVFDSGAQRRGMDEEIISRLIAGNLEGIPLLAKVGAALLRRSSDIMLWRKVLESTESKQSQAIYSLPPILYLSYSCLPFHLQQCFAYCSLFPREYKFHGEDLVYLWMAQDFISYTENNRWMEVIGIQYLNILVDLAFFEKVDVLGKAYYHMPGLIHDLAKSASSHECLNLVDGLPNGFVSESIRHLSIISEFVYKLDGHSQELLHIKHFEENLNEAVHALRDRSLMTLVLTKQYYSNFLTIFKRIVQEKGSLLRSLRVLWLNIMSFDFDFLIYNIGEFSHLRYLKLESNENNKRLPEALCQLHHLLVLDISGWKGLTTLPERINNLVNLRHFIAEKRLHSMIAEVGRLTFLQELQEFRVARLGGFEIAQVGNLKDLGGLLSIRGLKNVEKKEEAREAGLVYKERLRKLYLSWDATKSTRANSNPTAEAEVLEGLQPHNNLKELFIIGYGGNTSPGWLEINPPLHDLVSLHLEDCRAWEDLPPLGELPCLMKLKLIRMPAVKEVGVGFYGSNEMKGFKTLEELEFSEMPGLEKWDGVENYQIFPCLKFLTIIECPKLMGFPFASSSSETVSKHLFPQLGTLTIRGCPCLI